MKFRIKDDFGEKFEVEEIQDDFAETETETFDDGEDIVAEPIQDDEQLSNDEISALKKLAGVVDKLLALIPSEDEVQDDGEEIETEENIDETITDEDEEIETEEQVIDTNSVADAIGSLEKGKKARDSKTDAQEQIADKWQQNYSKFNK